MNGRRRQIKDMRDTHAALLAWARVGDHEITDQLGHADTKTTRTHYRSPLDEAKYRPKLELGEGDVLADLIERVCLESENCKSATQK